MTTSIFLAKLIGPCFVIIAISLLVNAKTFHGIAEQLAHNAALVFLVGHITLPAGLATVLTHNVWVADWPVLITILGWLAIIGGALRIIAPQKAAPLGDKLLARPTIIVASGVIWLVIGAVLCFFGYLK